MKTILALDQALSGTTGYSVYKKETKELVATGKYSGGTLLGNKDKLVELLEAYEPVFVLLEDTQQQRNAQTFKLLSALLGVLQVALEERGIKYEIVHVQRWRAKNDIRATNRATYKKLAQEKVAEVFNIKVTQDEAEAVLIGRYYFLSRIEF